MIWMGTFHSICGRMLRQRGHAIGIDPNFVVYDDADQLALIKQLINGRNIDGESIQPRAILSAISRAKEQLLLPEEFDARAVGYLESVAAMLYREYNRALR
ncbi:MAG: hypothetical protein C4340_06100, partial [Armatimonadota bacterium]